jgi:predicted DNA-binding transcriptional regulator AlpA
MEARATRRLLTPAEVAEKLKVKVTWVTAHSNGNRQPTIPSVSLGGHRRFLEEDIDQFINDQRKAA